MRNLRERISGNVYRRIMLFFLCMVIFSMLMSGINFYLFSRRSEETFLVQLEETTNAIGVRLDERIQTLFAQSATMLENILITENVRPYGDLGMKERFYYPSVINLLRQNRLQADRLVESIFLYADTERILYSMSEYGMAEFDTFFSAFMNYQSYDREFWQRQIEESGMDQFTILAADSYRTSKVYGEKSVIPLVWRSNGSNNRKVLVMNLSVSRVVELFTDTHYFEADYTLIYDSTGKLIYGQEDILAEKEIPPGKTIRFHNEDCYVTRYDHHGLGLVIYNLVPERIFTITTSEFRLEMSGIILVSFFCGLVIAPLFSRQTYEPIRNIGQSLYSAQDDPPKSGGYLKNELESISQAIFQLIDERNDSRTQNRQNLQHYMIQSFTALLNDQTLQDAPYFARLLRTDCGFSGNSYRCVVIVADNGIEKEEYVLRQEFISQLTQELYQKCENVTALLPLHWKENMLAVLMDGDTQEADIRAILAALREECARSGSFSLRTGTGNSVSRIGEIFRSLEQAMTEVFVSFTGEEKNLYSGHSFSYDSQEIVQAASTRDLKLIGECVKNILTRARLCGVTYSQAETLLRNMFQTIMDVQRHLAPRELQGAMTSPRKPFSAMEVLLLSPEINPAPLLSALLDFIPYQDNSTNARSCEDISRRAKAYIDSNYHRELSLEILSADLGISAKYLSRIFKQSMGINLSDYLTYVRVEKIKKLLKTGMSMENIAGQTGFNNRTTFTRVFKKLEGVSPNEYRRLHRSQSQSESADSDPSG